MDTNFIKDKTQLFLNNVVDYLPLFLSSVFIFIIFYTVAEYFKSSILPPKNKLTKTEVKLRQELSQELSQEIKEEKLDLKDTMHDTLIFNQLSWLIYYSIIVFGIIVSLANFGFNVATIIALLGSLGFALGLALQDTIKNIISGIYIIINKLFKIGDIISLKQIGNFNAIIGKIIDFTLYYTTIIDNNGIISMIPNSVVQNNIISNITLSDNYNSE